MKCFTINRILQWNPGLRNLPEKVSEKRSIALSNLLQIRHDTIPRITLAKDLRRLFFHSPNCARVVCEGSTSAHSHPTASIIRDIGWRIVLSSMIS